MDDNMRRHAEGIKIVPKEAAKTIVYKPSENLRTLAGEGAFGWLAKAREWERKHPGQKAIEFEIGEPDFETPKNIVEAGVKALRSGKTKYTESQGIRPLREAVAKFLGDRRGVKIDPDNVVVAHGLKCLVRATMEAFVDPDHPERTVFILPDPGYGPYGANVHFTRARVVKLPMEESKDWRFDPKVLERIVNDLPKDVENIVLIMTSPSNPTGGVLTREDLEFVAKLAKRKGMWVISDEVYEDIVFGGKFNSIYSLPGMAEQTILWHGASKSWAMTGWRLGFAVFPKEMVPHVTKLVGHGISSTAEFVQYAGIEAVSGPQDEVVKMREEYRKRRDYAVKRLRELGCECVEPQGAFYVFPNAKKWIAKVGAKDEVDLAERMLNETGVVTLPGTAFGENGKGHIRFSLASSMENFRAGFDRLEKWLSSGGKPLF